MKKFIKNPDITMHVGIVVDKETKLEYENENVKQIVENLMLHSVSTLKGDGYASTNHTTIYLEEGDVLIFEDGGRGYIKPVERFVTVAEAIEELECIKNL